MKCCDCDKLQEVENIEGGKFEFFCDYLGIEIENPDNEGCFGIE